jgi:hypothetical protein
MTERKFLFFDATEYGPSESDPTTDTIALAGLALTGNVALSSGAKVTGVPTPTADTDAPNKLYVDNLVAGTPWKRVECMGVINDALNQPAGGEAEGDAYIVGPVPAGAWSAFAHGDLVQLVSASWVKILDGGTAEPADELRIVVTDGTAAGSFAGEENNIGTYDAAGNTWSFIAAADGKAVIVAGEGALNENTGWVYDSSSTSWVLFSNTVGAGAGLYFTAGNVMNVGGGDGIAVNVDDIDVDLDATPGLEFNAAKLRVKTDGAHGIIRGASGLEIEIDDTPDTLDADADGLKVVGLPSLFKVNDVAVGATVTAANLDTLTDTSNADALHSHNITAVDEAKRVEDTHVNNVAIATKQVVRWSGVNNEITPADTSSAANARAIGVARVGGAGDPGTSEIVKHGICAGAVVGATVNVPYYLGAAGALVLLAAVPKPGRVVRIGYAINGTDLDVQIHDYGLRAA